MDSKLLLACAFLAVTAPMSWADFTCNPPDKQTTDLPVIVHKFFQIDFEEVDTKSNEVINNKLTYDGDKQIIRLTKTQFEKGTTDIFFDFKNSQKLAFNLKDRTCQATELKDNDPDFFLVGGRKGSTINSPLSVFHLEGKFGSGGAEIVVEEVKETDKLRGMQFSTYRSCQSWQVSDSDNTEVEVKVAVTDGQWSAVESSHTPMRMVVADDQLEKVYNYFNYRSKYDPSATNVPGGIFCVDMKPSVQFPAAPEYISFGQEVRFKDKLLSVRSTYDSIHQFALIDYLDVDNMNTIEYRDYANGVGYVVEKKSMQCTIKNITDMTKIAYDTNVDGFVRQLTPDAFMAHGPGVNYNYMGQTYYSEQLADVWNANFKLEDDDGVLEWYFLVEDENTETINDKTEEEKKQKYRLPLKRRFTPKSSSVDGQPKYVSEVFMYDVEYATPNYEMLDFEPCYRGNQMHLVTLSVKATQKEQMSIKGDINRFQWNTAKSLAIKLGVDLFRITGIEPSFGSGDKMFVDFMLLGPPPKVTDFKRQKEPISLDEAVANLKAKREANELTVVGPDMKEYAVTNMGNQGGTSKMEVKRKQTAQSNGYSSGAMAGLGIAMVIIGGGAGGFAAYKFINF